jgi:hypothetical protein
MDAWINQISNIRTDLEERFTTPQPPSKQLFQPDQKQHHIGRPRPVAWLAQKMDHTLLKPDATADQIRAFAPKLSSTNFMAFVYMDLLFFKLPKYLKTAALNPSALLDSPVAQAQPKPKFLKLWMRSTMEQKKSIWFCTSGNSNRSSGGCISRYFIYCEAS